MTEKLLTRIGGLLRQAESTDNGHEAEAFLAAAQRLAANASIDLAVARSHVAGRERRVAPIQRVIPIGEAGRRGLRTYVALFVAVASANDVRCDVARTSTHVYAFGFAADIDACEALYSSLSVQMVRASDLYLKSGLHRAERVATVTARLNFQLAFGARIGRRLRAARHDAEEEATTHRVSTETAVALRDKDIELQDFYGRESQARGTWPGATARAGYSEGARRAGDRAGRAARLGNSPELGGARGELER